MAFGEAVQKGEAQGLTAEETLLEMAVELDRSPNDILVVLDTCLMYWEAIGVEFK